MRATITSESLLVIRKQQRNPIRDASVVVRPDLYSVLLTSQAQLTWCGLARGILQGGLVQARGSQRRNSVRTREALFGSGREHARSGWRSHRR